MKKIKFEECICQTDLDGHFRIKKTVLDYIDDIKIVGNDPDQTASDRLEQNDDYHNHRVSKLDWAVSTDFERPWVKEFLPYFIVTIGKILPENGYLGMDMKQIWFQQYLEGDRHGWHIHGDHYTGVYYLEYPKSAAKTQICSPYNLRSQKIEGVEEGDMIIFPAHWIHRGLKNGKDRKTIVSYNFSINADSLLDTKLVGSVNNKKPYIIF